MDEQTEKTAAIRDRPFECREVDETRAAGENDIVTGGAGGPDHEAPEAWRASPVDFLPSGQNGANGSMRPTKARK
ncbi:MAG: hypothetical protein FKY71_01040 [Spiribacter salinus]|uniref:Uncharacterized protein n=1 Tax=Spiribacter salinus TaxID=1335746 RepID=A0A540VVT6_9GAMM|nr:MAG: hypothetical protein FKY71_01040 [Spiribacter salinus]